MDNYPSDLAPGFDNRGEPAMAFDPWWDRARAKFAHVPQEVAQNWIHKNWGKSPYGFLKSGNYSFRSLDWPLDQLEDIYTSWDDFSKDPEALRKNGDVVRAMNMRSPEVIFIEEHGYHPSPLVIIDNRDGHIFYDYPERRDYNIPTGMVLVDGHKRLNIDLSLQAEGKLQRVPAYVMEHHP